MNKMLNEYIDEMQLDLELDELNIKEVQMKIPALKHKWVGRLMRHKAQIAGLNRKRDAVKIEAGKKMRESSMYNVSNASLDKLIDKQDAMIQLNQEIDDLKIVTEFLEKSDRIFNSLTFDIKNLIEIIKLETM